MHPMQDLGPNIVRVEKHAASWETVTGLCSLYTDKADAWGALVASGIIVIL